MINIPACTWHKDGTQPYYQDLSCAFVFGSNLMGQHCGGAAKFAHDVLQAKDGANLGWTSFNSYAIATLDCNFQRLPLEAIRQQVYMLSLVARDVKIMDYFITRIGCGIAGFKDEEIAPMFKGFENLPNVSLPENWKEYIIN